MPKRSKSLKPAAKSSYDPQKALPGKTGDTQMLGAKVAALETNKKTPGFKEFGIAAKASKGASGLELIGKKKAKAKV